MDSPSSDDIWPPPVFRQLKGVGAPRALRRFELVDVGAPVPLPMATIDVRIIGSTWALVDGSATSPQLARRLIGEVRVEALRDGAVTLATLPDCAAVIVDALRSSGGLDVGKRVEIDV